MLNQAATTAVLLALATMTALSATAPVHANEFSKVDAARYLSAEKLGPSAGTTRIAITSCNVLFGMETSANAETQRGFGDTSKRIESKVWVSYQLRGLEPETLQQMTEQLCASAGDAFKQAGYEVLPASEVAANSEFSRLHATGQAVPYAYERAGSNYLTFAPAGQRVIDSVYLKQTDSVFSGFKNMSTDGPMFIEAKLAKSLGASPVHVNLMVDFATAESNSPKGLLGRFGGSDTAKVESKLEMSLNGFITLLPESRIDCSSGFCQGANDARLLARITSKAPLIGGSTMVREVVDAKTKGDKADELAGNIIGGLAALVGQAGSSYKITKNGVVVDPKAYADEAQRLTRQFVTLSASLLKAQ